jgi:hypothetical protein
MMNKSEIEFHIKRLQNGRAATSDPHQIELIDLGLKKYREMLLELEKKRESQPTGKTGQLPQNTQTSAQPNPKIEKREIEKQTVKCPNDEPGETLFANTCTEKTTLGRLPVATNSIEDATTLEIPMVNGTILTATYGIAKARARQYFDSIMTTEDFREKRYAAVLKSAMFKNLVRLVRGWGVLKSLDVKNPEYPTLDKIFKIQRQTREDRIVSAKLLLEMVMETINKAEE